jgi:hypothetical protein
LDARVRGSENLIFPLKEANVLLKLAHSLTEKPNIGQEQLLCVMMKASWWRSHQTAIRHRLALTSLLVSVSCFDARWRRRSAGPTWRRSDHVIRTEIAYAALALMRGELPSKTLLSFFVHF